MMAVTFPLSAVVQSATPDTSGYFIAGYVVIFAVMLVYLVSLVVRNRNLKQDYEMLEELEKSGTPGEEAIQSEHAGAVQK